MKIRIKNGQDFYGGLTILGFAIFVYFSASDLDSMEGYRFGAGTTPRLIAFLLGTTGLVLAVLALLVAGPKVGRFAIRGPTFVVASVLFFSAVVDISGIVIAGFITILIASMGSVEFRIRESLLVATILTTFCAVLFVGILNLPLELWPKLDR